MQVPDQGGKVAKRCVFPIFCGSGGSKSRLAKTACAEPSGEVRDEQLHAVVARSVFGRNMPRALLEVEMLQKCTPWWGEASFEVKRVNTPHAGKTFGC